MRKVLIAVIVVMVLLVSVCFFVFKEDIEIEEEMPSYFPENEEWGEDGASEIIKTPEEAVYYARTIVAQMYNEPKFVHNKASAYYDESTSLYYIKLESRLFHAEVFVVLGKDGSVKHMIHGKL